MLLIEFLPSWLGISLTTLAIIGLIATWFLTNLRVPFMPGVTILGVRVASYILLFIGSYLTGALAVQKSWEDKAAVMQAKVEEAERQANEATARVEYKYIDRVKVVKDTQVVVQEKIKEVEKVIDSKCEVAKEAIDIHNTAAKK